MRSKDKEFMRRAIQLAHEGMDHNSGGPFGAIVVKNNLIIAEGCNGVTSTNDPTAHAEVVAIRKACEKLQSFQLTGCTIYTSCEPCPMCLGAIYWARVDRVVFGCDRQDAADIAFDDQFIYDEIEVNIEDRRIPFEQILRNEAVTVFEAWDAKKDRTRY